MASCLANKDKAEAQYQLGIIYYHGLGVRKNLSEAKKWLRKASLRGDASAQGALGVLYGNGEGDWKNCGEAEKWLLKSAEQVPQVRCPGVSEREGQASGAEGEISKRAGKKHDSLPTGRVTGRLNYWRLPGLPVSLSQRLLASFPPTRSQSLNVIFTPGSWWMSTFPDNGCFSLRTLSNASLASCLKDPSLLPDELLSIANASHEQITAEPDSSHVNAGRENQSALQGPHPCAPCHFNFN